MKSSVKTAVNKEEQLSESRNTVMTTSGTFLQVATIIEECLTLRPVMSYIYIYIYIYGAPILDVSRSHTTTQHSR